MIGARLRVASAANRLLFNFEDGTLQGWAGTNWGVTVSGYDRNGGKAASILGSNASQILSSTLSLAASGSASIWVKTSAAPSTFRWRNNGGAWRNLPVSTSWTQDSGLVMSAGDNFIEIEAIGNGVSFYVDDIVVL